MSAINFDEAIAVFEDALFPFAFERLEYECFRSECVEQFIVRGYDYGEHCLTVLVSNGRVNVAVSDDVLNVHALMTDDIDDVADAAVKADAILTALYAHHA